jgi:hypothetical protein
MLAALVRHVPSYLAATISGVMCEPQLEDLATENLTCLVAEALNLEVTCAHSEAD